MSGTKIGILASVMAALLLVGVESAAAAPSKSAAPEAAPVKSNIELVRRDHDRRDDRGWDDSRRWDYDRDHERHRHRDHDRDRTSWGIYLGPDSFGLFLSNNRDPWRWGGNGYRYNRYNDYYRQPFYGPDLYFGHWYSDAGYFQYDPRYRYHVARGCHPVWKVGFDHGYRVRIGARMCYDRHGNGYIVQGSRRVLGYY